jgi:hypothetical protein
MAPGDSKFASAHPRRPQGIPGVSIPPQTLRRRRRRLRRRRRRRRRLWPRTLAVWPQLVAAPLVVAAASQELAAALQVVEQPGAPPAAAAGIAKQSGLLVCTAGMGTLVCRGLNSGIVTSFVGL